MDIALNDTPHIRATELNNTRIATVQSTKKGLVMTKSVMTAIIRSRKLLCDVITYCSKKINKRVMGKALRLDFISRSSRSVCIAFFRNIESSLFCIKQIIREASKAEPLAENFRS